MSAVSRVWRGVIGRLSSHPREVALATLLLIVVVNTATVCIAYRSVVFHGHTLLTGSVTMGTEGGAPAYGYSVAPGQTSREVDPGASAWQLVPWIRKASIDLTHGQLPLWDPSVMLGAPLLAAGQHGILDPLTWPLLAHPTPTVWDIWLLCRIVLAGTLCALAAKYMGMGLLPAMVAGIVYMMSGDFQVRTSTIQALVMAVFPLLIILAERCIRLPNIWSSAFLAIGISLTILAGMPEESLLAVLGAAIYFLVRLLADASSRRWRPDFRAVGSAVLGGAVGVLLSLPLLVPLAEYLNVGYTAHPPGSHSAAQTELGSQAMSLVGPHWTAPWIAGWNSGGTPPIDNWFGAAAILLAVFGAFSRVLPKGVRTLLIVAAVGTEAAILAVPPILNQLIANAPFFGQVSIWAYGGMLVSLAVALLVGAGLQSLQARQVPWRSVFVGALIVAVVMVSLGQIMLNGATPRAGQLAITEWAFGLVLVFAVLTRLRNRIINWTASLGIVGVVATELVLLGTSSQPLATRYDSLATTPTTAYLQQVLQPGSGRTYSPDGILYPTTNRVFGIEDIRNLDAIYVERVVRYLHAFVAPGFRDRLDAVGAQAATFNNNAFFDLMNVEYLLVGPQGGVVVGNQYQQVATLSDGVDILRNTSAAPRAQIFFDALGSTSEGESVVDMQASTFDPRHDAVIETTQALPSAGGPPIPADIVRYSDQSLAVQTSASTASVLVVADTYYPGWRATIDGRPANIYPADVAFRAVLVPAGSHVVRMDYQPESFLLGILGVPAGFLLWTICAGITRRQLKLRSRRV